MGLFSKTKTYVESTSVGIFAETRGAVQQSVLNSTVQDRSISDDLITNSLNGLGRKSKAFYRYGRDSYTYGLPEGSLEVKHASGETVQVVLQATVTPKATIQYSIFGVADPSMFAREFLVNTRDWNEDTDIISNPGFTPIGTVTLYSAEWLSTTEIKLLYLHDTVDNLHEEVITVEPVEIDASYYHVGYTETKESTELLYWYYKASLGTYETLNVDEQVFESSYFPVVPIIRDNVDLTAESLKDTELYQTSKRLLFKMGINFADIGSGVQQSPEIDAVDHAYINVSAPIQSTSKNVQMYLFEHFLELYNNQEYDEEYFNNYTSKFSRMAPMMNKVTVKEEEDGSGGAGRFHTELGFLYISSNIIEGVLGRKGTVTRETVLRGQITGTGYAAETSYMLWNKQVTPTQYRQLKVVGLKHINYIYFNKSIDTNLEDSLSTDNDDFNIMVNYKVLQKFNVNQKTDILNDTFRIILNSVERVKLKWYQTSIFKVIIIIVAAVITVFTGGSGAGFYAWAIGVTGATAFAVQLAIAIIINTLLSVLITKFVDIIGLKNAAILYFLYVIYSVYSGDTSLLTADGLISVVSGITESINYYLQGEYQDLVNDYEKLKAEQEAEQTELDKLIEAYPQKYLDPFSFLNVGALFEDSFSGESPEQYYTSRIHTGNIGTLALTEPSKYVDVKLSLPGLSDREALNIL